MFNTNFYIDVMNVILKHILLEIFCEPMEIYIENTIKLATLLKFLLRLLNVFILKNTSAYYFILVPFQ